LHLKKREREEKERFWGL
jgi:hypothetical protein